jgi:hypothetical protein
MIGNCFNPACKKELRYLRQGAIYQWEKGTGPEFGSEFFWLCPRCSSTFNVGSDRNGVPSLTPCGARGEGNPRCSRVRRVLRGILHECPIAGCPAEHPGADTDNPLIRGYENQRSAR